MICGKLSLQYKWRSFFMNFKFQVLPFSTLKKTFKYQYESSCRGRDIISSYFPILVVKLDHDWPYTHRIYQKKYIYSSGMCRMQTSGVIRKKEVFNPYEEMLKKKKEKERLLKSPLIRVMDIDRKMNVMTLESATKLAHHMNLTLMKVESKGDSKDKPLYQMMDSKHFAENIMMLDPSVKLKPHIKGQKHLILKDSIFTTDLNVKIKKIISLLDKQYEVALLIIGTNNEDILNTISKEVEGKGKIQEKQKTSAGVKIRICPVVKMGTVGNETPS